jgi:hypothetical protein
MKFKFPLLKIKVLNETIILTPLKFYLINVNDTNPSRLTILYDLTYKNDTETINAIIPYYISDGATNSLRANMLYPFICIQDDDENKDCPKTYDYITGVLIKYRTIKNLDFSIINSDIDEHLIDKFGKIKYSAFLRANDKYTNGRKSSVGIFSVLPRIGNLLDFMLAICSERIINTYPIKQYRPNYSYDIPPHRRPDPFDFTKNMLSTYESDFFLDMFDNYRLQLLSFFKNFYNSFVYYKIFENEFIELESSEINLKDFNKLQEVKICESFNKIYEDKINNTERYINISIKLNNMINKYIDINSVIVFDPERPFTPKTRYSFHEFSEHKEEVGTRNFKEKRTRFFSYIKKFIIEIAIYKKDKTKPLLPQNINDWGYCQKKYLKYKNKYLQLKKSLYDNTD